MSPSIPFSGLLDALRAKGMAIGVREYVEFAHVWTRMDGATVLELRVAAGALLGTSPEEVQLVVETFDELYGERPQPQPPPPPPVPLPWWRRFRERLRRSVLARWIASVALVGTAAAALWAWSQWQTALPALPTVPLYLWSPDWRPPNASRLDPTLVDQPVPPAPSLPPPPASFVRWAAWGTLGLSAVGTLLLVQWPRVRAAERRGLERTWRRIQAAMPGPSTFELAPADPPTWFDRRDLEDAATLLGRAFTTGFASGRLDPSRTVRRTIERGRVPTFVYEASAATGTLLVLEDIAPEMVVWHSKIAALLAALRRQGVRIERWVFDGTPALVGRDAFDERLPLEQVARRVTASGVLVMGSGSGLAAPARADGPDWREALSHFRRRSWLNPVVTAAAWRPALYHLPLNVWPLTGQGVLEAAADLAVDPEGRRRGVARDDTAATTVLADDVERLKRLVAVAGQPSLDLIEVLRQRFVPDVPEDAIVDVLREAEYGSPRAVRLPPDEVRRLLAAERRENPERERAVREYVVGLLAQQSTPAGSVAELRWRLADAAQRAALASLGVGDPAAPRDTLRDLRASPIWEEVRDTARGLGDVVPEDAFGPGGAQRLTATRPTAGTRGRATGPVLGRNWLVPRPLELAIAALMALAATAGLRAAGAFTGDAIPHVEDAFRLTFSDAAGGDVVAGVLAATRGPAAPVDLPTRVQLYRDGEPYGDAFDLGGQSVVERPIAVADTGHHYQVRAVLPQGNLAVSGQTWVAPPRQTLTLSVDALPWATMRVLDAQTGQPVTASAYTTPAVVNLAVGRYTLEFTHPEYGTTTRDVTVEPGSDPQVRVVMPGFDAAAVARELLGTPPRAQ